MSSENMFTLECQDFNGIATNVFFKCTIIITTKCIDNNVFRLTRPFLCSRASIVIVKVLYLWQRPPLTWQGQRMCWMQSACTWKMVGQPFMRDTVWNGEVQGMVSDDGTQKGMRTVLEERGINTSSMTTVKMREELQTFQASYIVLMI